MTSYYLRIYLVVFLVVAFMIKGFAIGQDKQHKEEVKTIDHIAIIYYGGFTGDNGIAADFDFMIRKDNRLHPWDIYYDKAPVIVMDVPKGQECWMKAYGYRTDSWNVFPRCRYLEIHIHSADDLSAGVQNMGKFGMKHYSVLDKSK